MLISEADTLTIRLGTTPSGLISDPTPLSPHFFTPDALPATTLPIYPGLGQAPNLLACIPSGVVHMSILTRENRSMASTFLHPPPDSYDMGRGTGTAAFMSAL